MKTIKHLLEMADNLIEQRGFEMILMRLDEMRLILLNRLDEGLMDNHRGDLEKKFDDLERKVVTARRALGKINSSKFDSEDQRKHKSIIMRHINAFRRELHAVMKELGMKKEEMDYHLGRMGMDREYGTPSELFTDRNNETEKAEEFRNQINKKRNLGSYEDIAAYNKFRPKDKPKSHT